MKLKITTVGLTYNEADKTKLERLGIRFRQGLRSGDWWCVDQPGEVELTTIEDLMRLVAEYGDVIVRSDQIVIYDDYVE